LEAKTIFDARASKYEMPDTIYEVTAYIDGASRGNPGPAAAGYILTDSRGTQLQTKAFFIGRATNNVAEYTGIIKALEAAIKIGAKQLIVFSDSELLVRQINGEYKVKSEQIRPLFQQAVDLLGRFENFKVRHITRDNNKQADKLVNQALNLEQDIEGNPVPPAQNKKTIQLGVLISGGGTTLMNILEQIKQGRLNAEVTIVISSRSTVTGVEKAKNAGLKVKIIRKKDFPDIDEFSRKIEQELVAANTDLVIQGGWLCLWKIPARYENRVMNIHPALLPSFGGQGMWGHYVHEAVLDAGCKISGCTVHFCTNEYDKGPIIVQRACEVKDTDTPDTLAARVFEQECIAYPQAIRLFAEGKIQVQDGKIAVIE
jgi:formyltetrahydrofolate-dependent phosphoribosylglycinamide formyltransferase